MIVCALALSYSTVLVGPSACVAKFVGRLFVPPTFVPNSALLVGIGCDVDDDGWVRVDSTGRTSVSGVWAAGNVVDPRAQVITAAGAGSAAATALNAELVDDEVRIVVRAFGDDVTPLSHTTDTKPKESA